MLGLRLGELLALFCAGYLVLRVLAKLAQVIWWYLADARRKPVANVYPQLLTSLAVAVISVGLLSIATGWPVQIPQIFAYLAAAIAGLFLGMIFDLILTFRFLDLSNYLMARRVPQYRERLLHGEDGARLFAAQQLLSLGRYAYPARPELLAALQAASAELRAEAAQALLYSIPEPPDDVAEVVRAARMLLADRELPVRVSAAAILVACNAPPADAIPVLCEGLTSIDPNFAGLAARALGRIGPAAEAALPVLRERGLDAEKPNCEAIDALGKIGSAAVPALIQILEQGNRDAAFAAVRALAEMGEPARPALPALRKLSIQNKALLSNEARKAIKNLGGDIA